MPNRNVLISIVLAILLSSASAFPQGPIRDRIQQRREARQAGEQTPGQRALEERAASRPQERQEIAGLNVAIWKPSRAEGKAPLIIFSHGYLGCNDATTFLMQRFAEAGYIVFAPNHRDALCGPAANRDLRPQQGFMNTGAWNERTYADRRDDIKNLLNALRQNAEWNSQIDWSRIGLVGHSLGGYTVLGLAGAWPAWKIPNVKAVLALAPYCEPYAVKGTLAGVRVPVMYLTGNRDPVTLTVKRAGGCFDKTPSPSLFVEFATTGHLSFTDLPSASHELIDEYSVAFFDKYVRGVGGRNLAAKQSGVLALKVK